MIRLNLHQARALLEFFGDEPADVTVREFDTTTCTETDEAMPEGLYAYITDEPGEGRVYLPSESAQHRKPHNDRLRLDVLRTASMLRLSEFRNDAGDLCHPSDTEPADGSNWSPADWLQAVMGELGEYANARKKYQRGDLTFDEFKAKAREELADTLCYLIILSARCLDDSSTGYADTDGIDLSVATIEKWNLVSEHRIGSRLRLAPDRVYRADLPVITPPDLDDEIPF